MGPPFYKKKGSVVNYPATIGVVSVHNNKKRGGKFQPFKKLFGKRKKKGTSLSSEGSAGRQSHSPRSASNGTFSSDEETLENNLRSFNYSMGARAFSHDSIFIPDGGAESEQTVQAMSQDNILGKVKTLQSTKQYVPATVGQEYQVWAAAIERHSHEEGRQHRC